MKNLLLTLDYELYGNGSGDIYSHLIIPTQRILELAKKYNVRITIFVEMVEFLRMEDEWLLGNDMGYSRNPIEDVRRQILDAYKAGHDIQLHIHPQWANAIYTNGEWNVDIENWRLSDFNRRDRNSLKHLIANAKSKLEAWIHTIDPLYECIAIRAGGYNVQPSDGIVYVMLETGLMIDSSIYPGGKEDGFLSNYDYTDIKPDCAFWHVGDTLENEGESRIIELPIVAFPIMRLKKYLSISRLKALLQNVHSARMAFNSKIENKKASPILNKFKFFFQREWLTWDYCLFSPRMHRLFINEVSKQKQRNVFTLVGHPKGFATDKGLDFLFRSTVQDFCFITLHDFYETIKSE